MRTHLETETAGQALSIALGNYLISLGKENEFSTFEIRKLIHNYLTKGTFESSFPYVNINLDSVKEKIRTLNLSVDHSTRFKNTWVSNNFLLDLLHLAEWAFLNRNKSVIKDEKSGKESKVESEPDFEKIKAWLKENLFIDAEYPISGDTPRITLNFFKDAKPFSSVILPNE